MTKFTPQYSIHAVLSVLLYILLANLLIPQQASAAFILGSQTDAPATVDLSVNAPADWIHWGYVPLDIDRKAGVTAQITDFTKVGGADPGATDLASAAYSWNDGIAPGGNISATRTGERVFQVGKGFQFTVPANTTLKTLRVYIGASASDGLLTATLSDGSAPAYTVAITQAGGTSSREISLDFIAAANAQTLTVSYVVTARNSAFSFITLESAALEAVGSNGAATLTGTMATVTNVNLSAKGPTDWIHWGRISDEPWDRKTGISPLISDQVHAGVDVSPTSATTDARYTWIDGEPNAVVSTPTGLRVFDINKGFSFTAPADTNAKTIRVYVGLSDAAQARFTATLSDASAPAFSTVISQASGLNTIEFTLNYQAASAGQQLTITYVRDNVVDALFKSWVSLESAKLLGTAGLSLPPAAAPTNIMASDNTFTSKIAVSWDAEPGATYYEVYRSTTAGIDGDLLAAPTVSNYDDTSAIDSTDYFYSVKACNNAGCTGFSNQDTGRRALAAPGIPTDVTASDDDFTTKIALSWTLVTGATYYEVYRSTTPGDNGTLQTSPAVTNYDDTSVLEATNYYYSVKACNSSGCSNFSDQDVGTRAILVVIPATPTGLAASDDLFTDRISVNWGVTSGATFYEIYRSTVFGDNGTLISTPIANTFDDLTALVATDYFYSIKACNTAGCSNFNTQDSGRRAETVPANPPSNVAATDETFTDKVVVSWDAVNGSTFYQVYRSAVMGNDGVLLASPTGINYDDTSAIEAMTYHYSVKACNSAGCSTFSAQDAGATATAVDPLDPVITAPADIVTAATRLLTPVDLGSAIATDNTDGVLIAIPDIVGPFLSGRHIITWSVTNSANRTATAQQIVDIQPIVDFQLDQSVGEGGLATVSVYLSGQAAIYPVTIPYSVSGTSSNPNDHDAVSGNLVINQGTSAQVTFNVVADAFPDEGETIIFTMETTLSNAVVGTNNTHVATIVGENLPPRVQLTSSQAPLASNWVVADQGDVIISTTVTDPNPVDTHTYDWNLSDNALVPTEGFSSSTFTFNPLSLGSGVYVVRITVTDNGLPVKSTTVELMLRVDTSRPALTTADSDNDGIDDIIEGYTDSDDDGIADYLDAVDDPALLAGSSSEQMNFLLQVNPGLTMKLGQTATAAGQNSASVTTQNIIDNGGSGGAAGLNTNDDGFTYPVGIFDFVVGNLPIIGQSVNIVIPVQGMLPDSATYRKYMQDLGWQDFVEDANNTVASALGSPGICPPPGDNSYITGLGIGHNCVQLTIEDGGPNDSDTTANGIVRDPGGVAQPAAAPNNNNSAPTTTSSGGGGGYMLMLISMIYLVTRKQAKATR